MEPVSALVGRVPIITANGKELRTRLGPERVSEAISRAQSRPTWWRPKVRELAEVRAMQVTITGVALSEI